MKVICLGLLTIIVLVLILGATACSKSAGPESNYRAGDSSYITPGVAPGSTKSAPLTTTYATATTTTAPKYSGSGTSLDSEVAPWSSVAIPTVRMVVRTGSIVLVVDDVADSLDKVVKLAGDLNGYVVSSQKWKEGERTMGSISIRVPSGTYDQTITSLRNLAMDVVSENSSSQDVTQEYVDLESRLKNLEASQSQLLKIMTSATKTEDVLSVQRELTNVNGQIEQTKGRLQYLEETSAMSLIDIKLQQALLEINLNANKTSVKPDEKIFFEAIVKGGFAPYNYIWDFGDGNSSNLKSPMYSYKDADIYTVSLKVTDDKGYTNSIVRIEYINVSGGWGPGSTVSSAWNGFIAFGRVLVDILVWLGIFSPVWLVVGGIIFWRMYRKRKKKASGV